MNCQGTYHSEIRQHCTGSDFTRYSHVNITATVQPFHRCFVSGIAVISVHTVGVISCTGRSTLHPRVYCQTVVPTRRSHVTLGLAETTCRADHWRLRGLRVQRFADPRTVAHDTETRSPRRIAGRRDKSGTYRRTPTRECEHWNRSKGKEASAPAEIHGDCRREPTRAERRVRPTSNPTAPPQPPTERSAHAKHLTR